METMSFWIEERHRPAREIVNPVQGADDRERANHLRETALSLAGALRVFTARIDTQLGCRSEVNVKSFDAILGKARRPSIIAARPWFSVAHVRDCLRFRSSVDSLDRFLDVLLFFSAAAARGEIAVVKIDWQKFFRPSVFGWRMIALDIRLKPSGFLVEYYVTYADMIDVNERLLHQIFENWRNQDPLDMPLKELTRRSDDIAISHFTYYSWMFRCLACDPGTIMMKINNIARVDSDVNAVQNCRDHTESQIAEAMVYFENQLENRIVVK